MESDFLLMVLRDLLRRRPLLRLILMSATLNAGLFAAYFRSANTTAAEALNLTATDNLKHGLVDAIIEEPDGGAHRDPDAAANTLQAWILDQLADLSRIQADTLVRQRFEKFRAIGPVVSMEMPDPVEA